MDLHRPKSKPDWQLVDEKKWSVYQRIAHATGGVITPGNIITTAGLLLVGAGLYLLVRDVSITALALIAIGRVVDLLDGYIANKTNTKSSIGEAYDSVADKLTAFAVLILFVMVGIIAVWQAGLLLLIQVINSVFTIKAKATNQTIHSSRAGKQATFLLWLTVGLFAVVAIVPEQPILTPALSVLGNGLLIATLVRGLQASYGYYQQTKLR